MRSYPKSLLGLRIDLIPRLVLVARPGGDRPPLDLHTPTGWLGITKRLDTFCLFILLSGVVRGLATEHCCRQRFIVSKYVFVLDVRHVSIHALDATISTQNPCRGWKWLHWQVVNPRPVPTSQPSYQVLPYAKLR